MTIERIPDDISLVYYGDWPHWDTLDQDDMTLYECDIKNDHKGHFIHCIVH